MNDVGSFPRRLIPSQKIRAEITVDRSRFIASLAPANSVQEAKEFIHKIRKQYADATHNVPAFLIGHGSSVTAHARDDGEPFGTAGKPALAVLQGSGIGDVVVVVTRYFGGTKLGKGGLVRAYSDAVREVLGNVNLAEKVSVHDIRMIVPYSLFEPSRLLALNHGGIKQHEDFAQHVTMDYRIKSDIFSDFDAAFIELTRGKHKVEVLSVTSDAIFPLNKTLEELRSQ